MHELPPVLVWWRSTRPKKERGDYDVRLIRMKSSKLPQNTVCIHKKHQPKSFPFKKKKKKAKNKKAPCFFNFFRISLFLYFTFSARCYIPTPSLFPPKPNPPPIPTRPSLPLPSPYLPPASSSATRICSAVISSLSWSMMGPMERSTYLARTSTSRFTWLELWGVGWEGLVRWIVIHVQHDLCKRMGKDDLVPCVYVPCPRSASWG